MTDARIIVIGGGIAGCLTACELSNLGYDVALIDANDELMSGASRWNEGKIHLGLTYLGTDSLDTARLMLEGAAVFEESIERITGTKLPQDLYTRNVIYLVDRDSQFPPEVLWERANAVARLLHEMASSRPGLKRYLHNGPVLKRIDPEQAAALTRQERVVDAWETVEKSIAPGPLATLIRTTVGERGIPVLKGRVCSIQRNSAGWIVESDRGSLTATIVVNCSWESRAALDRGVMDTDQRISIRYKSGIFCTQLPSAYSILPSTRILGRFGDITPYANGDLYLSWYPAGLAGSSDNGVPPELPQFDEQRIIRETLDGLGLDRSVLDSQGAGIQVRGGYIVAHGYGDIDHKGSPLHRRSQPGAHELRPDYISVDTGKYSLGPMMARRAAALVQRQTGTRK